MAVAEVIVVVALVVVGVVVLVMNHKPILNTEAFW